MSPQSVSVLTARNRLASASRLGASPEKLDEARRVLTSAKLERAIREARAASPSLTLDQRTALAALLLGGEAK